MSQSQGKFSIVLPVKNGGEYVKECVHSILQQDYEFFDLLILENCSTDDTLRWLQTINDKRVRILASDSPLSMEENWSRLLYVPKNEFITIIGHDDVLSKHYLNVMDALILKHPQATLYQTHFSYINETGIVIRQCLPMCEVQKGHEFLANQLMRTLDSTATGYMFRSGDFDDIGGFSNYKNLIFGDYELWVKLACKGYIATDLSESFLYRAHASASAQTRADVYLESLEKYICFLSQLSANNEQLQLVLERYGMNYLTYMCEFLINRNFSTGKHMHIEDIICRIIEIINTMPLFTQADISWPVRINILRALERLKIGGVIFKSLDVIKPKIKNMLLMIRK